MIVEPQYIFSYWIFVWFLCYQFGLTTYNPYVSLWVALVTNILTLFYMFYYRNDAIYIFLYVFINTWIKVFPIWLLRKSAILWKDIRAGLILYAIYLLFLAWNDKLFNKKENVFLQINDSIQHNQPITPFVAVTRKWLSSFQSGY
jgi:hypothetical protein